MLPILGRMASGSKALVAICSVVATQISCDRVANPGRAEVLQELAGMGTARVFAPRLSITSKHRPCSLRLPPAGGTIPVADCGPVPEPSPEIFDLSTRVRNMVDTAASPEALHAAALLDMVWEDSAGNSLQESISFLRNSSRLADRPAQVHADLAAAYLVRAERTQAPRDLLEAIETADLAGKRGPRDDAAFFNLALALDRLGLGGQALNAWEEFLMVDSTSGWAMEARQRVRELRTVPTPAVRPSTDASPAEAAAYATRAPQEARLWGWDHLLGEWGTAVLDGDSARAEGRLRLASALGEALEARKGDATLADAVLAIRRRSGEHSAMRTLALAHREYAAGRAAYLASDSRGARLRFAQVIAARPPSAALRGWASMSSGAALVRARRLGEAERVFRLLAVETDTIRAAALAGSARWGLATTLLRDGRYEPSLAASRDAARFFERAGEREHLGGAQYLSADVAFALRAVDEGYASMHRALATLRPYGGSVWLHNLLSVAAEAAAADGLVHAAARIQDEGVAVADRSGRALQRAEARLWRAYLRTTLEDSVGARDDLERAGALLRRVPPGDERSFLEIEGRLARAGFLARREPARAEAALDTVLLPGGALTSLQLLRALVGRGEVRLALGDAPVATADLERATALLNRQREEIARTPFRASLVDAARGVFDRLVMLRVAVGDTLGALAYLERGRTSFAASRGEETRGPQARWRVPSEAVAIEYAHVGDTLLIFTVSGGRVRLVRSRVGAAALARSIERARSSLELGAKDDVARPDLSLLYDWLVRPVRDQLGPEGTSLLLVADGEIAAVPFAALYDTTSRRYLVEDYSPRFIASLRDASAAPVAGDTPDRALLAVDPGLDPRARAALGTLPGAAAEVREVAAAYPRKVVLRGAAADWTAVTSALARASVVHFAGHAVFDDERPDRSFLVLAPGGRVGSGRLTAAELEGMDLRHVRLVVLSACQTLRSRGGRSGGFAGFTDALLAAGAGGVVGSLWRVDDDLTRALIIEFHQEYRASGDASDALRAAQLRLLRDGSPEHRSPAAWAGFRYAGN